MDQVDRLDARLAADLSATTRVLEHAGIPYAVIGANALILQEIKLPRTTRDLDLVVVAEGGLDRLRLVLEDAGFRSTRVPHRFVAGAGTEIDVLPLLPGPSPVIDVAEGERISSIGLPEAIRNAEELESEGSVIRVASLPVLAAVKVHTATIRVGDRDLLDALAIMEQYEAHGTRRFELDYDAVPELVWETAGAFLLGVDAGLVLRDEARDWVEVAAQALLQDPRMDPDHTWGQEKAPLLRGFRQGLASGLLSAG